MKRLILTALVPLMVVGTTISCTRPHPPRDPMEVWAFCGPDPSSLNVMAQLRSLRDDAGIDAIFGHCFPPDWSTYTPANPGQRYMDTSEYLKLVRQVEALGGLKVVVYDARVWSDDPSVRQQAIDLWTPYAAFIRAWDMGDEYDPDTPDWQVLVHRWNIVEQYVTPVTGVGPYTNHLGSAGVLDLALIDMPSQRNHLSYDAYDVPASLALAERYAPQASHLMCAVNGLEHNNFHPSAWSIEVQMQDHRDAGCDSILLFGGVTPTNTPGFSTPSLVNADGTPTPWAAAVERGAL